MREPCRRFDFRNGCRYFGQTLKLFLRFNACLWSLLIRRLLFGLFAGICLLVLSACTPLINDSPSKKTQAKDVIVVGHVASPDESLNVFIRQLANGSLEYSVRKISQDYQHKGRRVLGWSALGIVTSTADDAQSITQKISDFRSTITFSHLTTSDINERYTMKTGKRRENFVNAKQLSLTFIDDETKKELRIDFRVSNKGFGFRYVLPEKNPLMTWLVDEATTFNVGLNGTHWGQPYDVVSKWSPAYETAYLNGVPTGTHGELTGRKTGWAFPALFNTQAKDWVLLHEANVDHNNHGSHIKHDASDGVYKIAFPLEKSAMGFGRNSAVSALPWVMPWRMGIVSEDLADIVESNLTFDLSAPQKIDKDDWIKPGLATWSWWSDHGSSRDENKLKAFIDLAYKMQWPYSLIDANWNTISESVMDDLVAYANKKDVGLLFWYNSGGRHNAVSEQPRNIVSDFSRRRAEFKKLHRLGVKGIKVDFFHSDKQDVMNLYLDILRDAAEFELMVVFHGSTIPRGWERTWPNLMSMESVRGAEYYTFESDPEYGSLAKYQNAILPFTRNLVGSMDYTPVSYDTRWVSRQTTQAHETALSVIFESGIQHIGSSAQSLKALPPTYKKYFSELPVAWDETKFIDGFPGQDIVLARKSGSRWYIAGINGEAKAKELLLDLSFIQTDQTHAELFYDGDDEQKFYAKTLTIENIKRVPVQMKNYGGFVLTLDEHKAG